MESEILRIYKLSKLIFVIAVGMVIQLLNILGKIVWEHFVDSVLVAVSNGSIVVPALKAEHIKRLLKTLNFLFYGFFLIFKKFSPLRIGRTALGAVRDQLFRRLACRGSGGVPGGVSGVHRSRARRCRRSIGKNLIF